MSAFDGLLGYGGGDDDDDESASSSDEAEHGSVYAALSAARAPTAPSASTQAAAQDVAAAQRSAAWGAAKGLPAPPRKRKRVSWAPGTDLTQTFFFTRTERTGAGADDDVATAGSDTAQRPLSFSSEALFGGLGGIGSGSSGPFGGGGGSGSVVGLPDSSRPLSFAEKRLAEQRAGGALKHARISADVDVADPPAGEPSSSGAAATAPAAPAPAPAPAPATLLPAEPQLELFCDECDATIPRGRLRFDCGSCELAFSLCQACYKAVHAQHPHRLVPNVSARHLTD